LSGRLTLHAPRSRANRSVFRAGGGHAWPFRRHAPARDAHRSWASRAAHLLRLGRLRGGADDARDARLGIGDGFGVCIGFGIDVAFGFVACLDGMRLSSNELGGE
jgi:hypothetical protein